MISRPCVRVGGLLCMDHQRQSVAIAFFFFEAVSRAHTLRRADGMFPPKKWAATKRDVNGALRRLRRKFGKALSDLTNKIVTAQSALQVRLGVGVGVGVGMGVGVGVGWG